MIRRPRHPVQTVRRYVSSKSPKPSSPSLPPAKMRALISLYHQSESFITPENLSERIDHAFLSKDMHVRAFTPNASLPDLRRSVKERRNAPRIGAWDDQSNLFSYRSEVGWSDTNSSREKSVIEALYGVYQSGKPGLEVLEESGERIEQNILDDQNTAHDKP